MPRHHARASRRVARRRRDRGGAESSPYSKLRDIALSWLIRCIPGEGARYFGAMCRDLRTQALLRRAAPCDRAATSARRCGLSGRWHPAARRPAPGADGVIAAGRHVLLLPGLSLRVSPHAASHGARAHEAEGGRRHMVACAPRARVQRAHRAVCVSHKAALSHARAAARDGAHSRRRIGRRGQNRGAVSKCRAATARHCTKCSRRARPTSR